MEDGRRCGADGVGNPPLCPPHGAILRATAEAPHNPLGTIVDSLKNGRPITVADAVSAAADLLSTMLGGRPFVPPAAPSSNYRPGHGPPPSPDDWDPFSAWRQQRQAPPPRSSVSELTAQRAAARKVFGWANMYLLVDADELKARYRELAKKHHPDRGGSAKKMAQVNAAMDVLTAELESR